MIKRHIIAQIRKRIDDPKAIIILGPRQSGKTTLVRYLVEEIGKKFLWLNGDETDVRTLLEKPNSTVLKNIIGKNKILVIDEAQRIKNIGLCIKLVTDNIPSVKVIATGSSSFELANQINEPLTGRKWEFFLLPFSFAEMTDHHGLQNEKRLLERRMIYGYYPEVVNNENDEKERLRLLADSYLYKDILTWENIQKPDKLEKLVQALALQTGNEVSFHELGQICGLDNETIEKYISLLEKAFIVFRLNSLSRNLRNELKKSKKIYFYDNGLRNAVINQFNPLELRNDKGALWENFLITERIKYINNERKFANQYFWRTHAQQEIDYIEEQGGKLFAFEFKWERKTKNKFPKNFLKAYPQSETEIIDRNNFEKFVGVK
jgi:hypothetical protein